MSLDKTKEIIKTSICKVYWHGVEKYRWEYEGDLKKISIDSKSEQDT